MIQSENAPSLCPRCTHFTKHWDVGCKIGNYDVTGWMAETIQEWRRNQTDETSWTYMGACPGFVYNGSSDKFMGSYERRALRKILGL